MVIFFHSKRIKYRLKPQILGFIYPGLYPVIRSLKTRKKLHSEYKC